MLRGTGGQKRSGMSVLDRDDLERILDLISALAETCDLQDYVHTTMHGLLELIPSIDVSYNIVLSSADSGKPARYEP
jgi:hypothetical protein